MRRLIFPLVLLTSLVATQHAHAEGAGEPTGALAATLRTRDGLALPQVVLRLTGGGLERTVVTTSGGRFEVPDLPAGEYTLTVQAPALELAPGTLCRVEAGESVSLDLVAGPTPVREHVVVSAARGEAATGTLGASVTVIDHDRLTERQAPALLELLQDAPGIAVARSGGVGGQASVFLRGGESRFARVMVDGIPLNEPGGAYNFGTRLPLELERVEVVRGATSSLYGTDALAGVVNLVTRRAPASESLGFSAAVEGGSDDQRRAVAGLSGRRGRVDWNLGLMSF
jgi:outer membrane cobalamin receptor